MSPEINVMPWDKNIHIHNTQAYKTGHTGTADKNRAVTAALLATFLTILIVVWIFVVRVQIWRFGRGSDDVDSASEELGSASCLLFCLKPKMWVSPVNTLNPKLWAHVSFLSNLGCLNSVSLRFELRSYITWTLHHHKTNYVSKKNNKPMTWSNSDSVFSIKL